MVLRAGRSNNVAHQWKPSLCARLAAEEHRHKGAFVGNLSSLSGAAHPYSERVKIYYAEVKRWKRFNKGLPIADIYQRQKGAFFNCSFLFSFLFFWKCVGKSCREPNPSPNLYTASFQRYTSPSEPTLMASKSPTVELQSVCLQTDEPGDPLLVVYEPCKKNGIYICLYVCVHGWKWWHSGAIYTHLFREFFF